LTLTLGILLDPAFFVVVCVSAKSHKFVESCGDGGCDHDDESDDDYDAVLGDGDEDEEWCAIMILLLLLLLLLLIIKRLMMVTVILLIKMMMQERVVRDDDECDDHRRDTMCQFDLLSFLFSMTCFCIVIVEYASDHACMCRSCICCGQMNFDGDVCAFMNARVNAELLFDVITTEFQFMIYFVLFYFIELYFGSYSAAFDAPPPLLHRL
jgi:hypothetical protein